MEVLGVPVAAGYPAGAQHKLVRQTGALLRAIPRQMQTLLPEPKNLIKMSEASYQANVMMIINKMLAIVEERKKELMRVMR